MLYLEWSKFNNNILLFFSLEFFFFRIYIFWFHGNSIEAVPHRSYSWLRAWAVQNYLAVIWNVLQLYEDRLIKAKSFPTNSFWQSEKVINTKRRENYFYFYYFSPSQFIPGIVIFDVLSPVTITAAIQNFAYQPTLFYNYLSLTDDIWDKMVQLQVLNT